MGKLHYVFRPRSGSLHLPRNPALDAGSICPMWRQEPQSQVTASSKRARREWGNALWPDAILESDHWIAQTVMLVKHFVGCVRYL